MLIKWAVSAALDCNASVPQNHAHMIYDSLILSDATPQRKNITQNGKSAHFMSYV